MPADHDDLWNALEGLRENDVVMEARAYSHRWARSRRRMKAVRAGLPRSGAAVAICVAAATLTGSALRVSAPSEERVSIIDTTGMGTRLQVLPDGSSVMLNVDSRVRVAFTPASRTVILETGEAHFEVAKALRRPFRVRAGNTEIVAVGTAFDVTRLSSGTKVTLIEGQVDVRAIPESGANATLVATLHPSQELSLAQDGHVVSQAVARIEAVTAWQRGMIDLDDTPLSQALLQVNRYATVKIALADSSLAGKKISGVFRVGDTAAFVSAVERYFGLRARWKPDQSVVLERP
jgi:transmembrane sensor